jgi:hypothetical protein
MSRTTYIRLAAAATVLATAAAIMWRSGPAKTPAPVTGTGGPEITTRSTRPPSAPPADCITGLGNHSKPWQVRLQALNKGMSRVCTETDIRSLYALLSSGQPGNETPATWYVIANGIMDQLVGHDREDARFTRTFLAIARDPHQPDVLRDYAVQHLAGRIVPAAATPPATGGPVSPSPHESAVAPEILQGIASLATDPSLASTSIPGTSLMMLSTLVATPGPTDCRPALETIRPWLQSALSDGSTQPLSTQVSAVRFASVVWPAEFRPRIREIAYRTDGGSALRLPAIAAIAACGDPTDIPKLREIAANTPALSFAAKEAAGRLCPQ